MKNLRSFFALLGLFNLIAAPGIALNPAYRFQIIGINGQTIDGLQLYSFNNPPCLNDEGEVVFLGTYFTNPGNAATALFSRDHVLVKTGDKVDGKVLTGIGNCALGDSGDLVFEASTAAGSALYRKRKDAPAERVVGSLDKIDGLAIQQFYSYFVNGYGRIVFSATYTGRNGISGLGIFTPDSLVVRNGSVVDGHTLNNIDGMIAASAEEIFFHAFDTNGLEAIFTPHRVVVKAGDSIDGFTLMNEGGGAFGYPAVSRLGHLVFGAGYAGGSGVFTPHSIISPTTGPLPTAAGINDFGQAVYVNQVGNQFAYFVNSTELIETGDSLGSHLINGVAAPPVINDRGQVAFEVNFTSAGSAIVLATPEYW